MSHKRFISSEAQGTERRSREENTRGVASASKQNKFSMEANSFSDISKRSRIERHNLRVFPQCRRTNLTQWLIIFNKTDKANKTNETNKTSQGKRAKLTSPMGFL